MLSSSTTVKPLLQKKKQSSTTTSVSTSVELSMNRTSLSTISTASQNNNKEKLTQLKEKLEKQRQSMRSTGRRFREGGKSQVQIQTDDEVQNQNRRDSGSKGLRVSKGIGTSTATAGLFDFGTIKTQVENKMRGGFIKKAQQVKKTDVMIPVYTTKQILQMSQTPSSQQNIKSNRPLHSEEKKQLRRETVSLMELSRVIAVDGGELNSNNKGKQENVAESGLKFVDVQKTSKKKQQSTPYMNNSQTAFSAALNDQKKRNNEVRQFLSQANLQRFADELISLGFDEVQTLLEVSLEELNIVRMRAKEQDALMNYINEYKVKNNIQNNNSQLHKHFLLTSDKLKPINRLRTPTTSSRISTQQPSQTTTEASRLRSMTFDLSQTQLLAAKNLSASTLSNKSSIFYCMGGDQWSLQSQIRKACSGCFKVSYQGVKRNECYYCEKCDPGEEGLQISLDSSMIRDYR